MDKKQISSILNKTGILLELRGENPFKVRAYQNAARSIDMLDTDPEQLVKTGAIKNIKGIGNALAEKIKIIVTTGDLPYYQELKNSIPDGLLEMLNISGLGPKKIHKIHSTLGIDSVSELEYSCHENRLLDLKGFGSKTQQLILREIEILKKFSGQFFYSEVIDQARDILKQINKCSLIREVQIAGSLRRHLETVRNIDLVASSPSCPEKALNFFSAQTNITGVTVSEHTKTFVILDLGNIKVNLYIVSAEEFPYALHYFTGSLAYNAAIHHRAENMGIKINKYGLFKDGSKQPVSTEKEFFHLLGLRYIAPVLRENMGEIEAAEKGLLPKLIEKNNIKGIFHVHTNYSDGINTIAEMAEEAQNLGFQYMGVSDHSRSAHYAGGLKLNDIIRQHEEINSFNKTNKNFHIFHGIESDILPDGSLDYPDDVLSIFDFIIVSIHSSFSITGKQATDRLVKAMSNPYTTMLGHPTGRLLLGRKGYDPDMQEIIKAAKKYNVIIELNANQQRLDIDWRHLKAVRQHGVKISINPDAHRKEGLIDTFTGTEIAAKGWIEEKDVFNTLPAEEIMKYLEKKRPVASRQR